MIMDPEKYIYKITSKELWSISLKTGTLALTKLDIDDGFIHFSNFNQLKETLRLYFRGQKDLVLLAVALQEVINSIKWEKSRNNELFPHLYGKLNINLVRFAKPINVDNEGNVNLSEIFR